MKLTFLQLVGVLVLCIHAKLTITYAILCNTHISRSSINVDCKLINIIYKHIRVVIIKFNEERNLFRKIVLKLEI